MIALKIAFRNIFAHLSKNLIIFFVISFVTCILFLFLTFSDGMIENIQKSFNSIVNPKADIIIRPKGFLDAYQVYEKWENIVKMIIKDYPIVMKDLSTFSFIKSSYVQTTEVLSNIYFQGKRYKYLSGYGLQYNNCEHILDNIEIIDGRFFKEKDQSCILFHHIAKRGFNVKIGDIVSIVGNDLFGQAFAHDCKVIGFYRGKIDHYDLKPYYFVDMHSYHIISGLNLKEAHAIHAELKKGIPVNKALTELIQSPLFSHQDVEFHNANKMPGFGSGDVYESVRIIFVIVCFLVIFIILIGIINVISSNLLDRKKEIGSYYCLGAEKGLLMRIYIFEIIIIDLLSAANGIILGLFIRFFVNRLDIQFQNNPGIQNVLGGDRFYLGFSYSSIFWILFGLITISLITGFIILRFSLDVPPVEAVRVIEE